MRKSAWKDIAKWPTDRLSSCTKSPGIPRSVNKFARAVTWWTRATNAWLVRSPTFITRVMTGNIAVWVMTAQHCRLVLFQDSDFAGDLEASKSTAGEFNASSEVEALVPTSCMCKKQTSVCHSLTESEVISLDAGLRMDGIPALDLWHLVIDVLHSSEKRSGTRKPIARRDQLSGVGKPIARRDQRSGVGKPIAQ